jgi:hypothetical protein
MKSPRVQISMSEGIIAWNNGMFRFSLWQFIKSQEKKGKVRK